MWRRETCAAPPGGDNLSLISWLHVCVRSRRRDFWLPVQRLLALSLWLPPFRIFQSLHLTFSLLPPTNALWGPFLFSVFVQRIGSLHQKHNASYQKLIPPPFLHWPREKKYWRCLVICLFIFLVFFVQSTFISLNIVHYFSLPFYAFIAQVCNWGSLVLSLASQPNRLLFSPGPH